MAKVVKQVPHGLDLSGIPDGVLTPGSIQGLISPEISSGFGNPASDINIGDYGKRVRNNFLTGDDTADRYALDETRARNQSGLGLVGKAFGNVASTFVSELLKAPGYAGGFLADTLSGNVFKGNFDNTVDNFWINSFSWLKENSTDKIFEVYKPPSLDQGGLREQILNPYFWAKEGADGVGFLLSFLIPGQALKLLNIGSKASSAVAKGISSAEDIGLLLSDVDRFKRTSNLLKSIGKSGHAFDFEKMAGRIDSGLAIGVNTILEAAAEGSNTYDNLIQQGYSAEEAGKAASNVVKWNLPVLLASNTILEKFFLSGFGRLSGKSGFSRLTPDVIEGTKTLSKQRNFIKPNLVTAIAQEGFFEEGLQNTIEQTQGSSLYDIASKYYDNFTTMLDEDASQDAIDFGKSVILGSVLGGGVSALANARENNASNRLLFGQTARPEYKPFNKFVVRKAREAKEGLISVFKNNYATIKQDGKELFNYDDNGNIAGFKEDAMERLKNGVGTNLLVNFYHDLIRKYDGNAQRAKEELTVQFAKAGADIHDIFRINNDLSNTEVLEQIKQREDIGYFLNFLTEPTGFDLLKEHIPAISRQVAERYKNNTGQELPNIKEIEQELLDKATKFNDIYNAVDKTHSPYRLQVDPFKSGNDPDRGILYQKFFSNAKMQKLIALADIELAEEKLKELDSYLEPLRDVTEISPVVAQQKKTWEKDKKAYEDIKREAEEEFVKLDNTSSLQELWEEAYRKQKTFEEVVKEEEIQETLDNDNFDRFAAVKGYGVDEPIYYQHKEAIFSIRKTPEGLLASNILDPTKNRILTGLDPDKIISKQDYEAIRTNSAQAKEQARQKVKRDAIAKTLRSKLTDLSNKQAATKNAIKDVESQVENLRQQVFDLLKQLDSNNSVKNTNIKKTLDAIHSTIDSLQDTKNKLEEELYLYQAQEELLLNIQNDPNYFKEVRKQFPKIEETIAVLRELRRSHKEIINKYELEIERLKQVEAELLTMVTQDDINKMLHYKELTNEFIKKYSYTDLLGNVQTVPEFKLSRIIYNKGIDFTGYENVIKFIQKLAIEKKVSPDKLREELSKDLRKLNNTIIPTTEVDIETLLLTKERIKDLKKEINSIYDNIVNWKIKEDRLVYNTLSSELMNMYKQVRKADLTSEEYKESGVSNQDKPENEYDGSEVWWDKVGNHLFVTTGISVPYGDDFKDIYVTTDGVSHPAIAPNVYQQNWFEFLDSNSNLTDVKVMLVTATYETGDELQESFAASNPNDQRAGEDVYAVLVDGKGKVMRRNGLPLFTGVRRLETMFPSTGIPAINMKSLVEMYANSIGVTSFETPNAASKAKINAVFNTEKPSTEQVNNAAIAYGKETYRNFLRRIQENGTMYAPIEEVTAGHPLRLYNAETGELLTSDPVKALGLKFDNKGLPANFEMFHANKDGIAEVGKQRIKGLKSGVVYVLKDGTNQPVPLISDMLNEGEIDVVLHLLKVFSKRQNLDGMISPNDIQATGFDKYMVAGIDKYSYEAEKESDHRNLKIFPNKSNRFSLMTLLMNWGNFDNPDLDIYFKSGNLVLGDVEIPSTQIEENEELIRAFLANKRFHINFQLFNHATKREAYTAFSHPVGVNSDGKIQFKSDNFLQYTLSRASTEILPKAEYAKYGLPQFAQRNVAIGPLSNTAPTTKEVVEDVEVEDEITTDDVDTTQFTEEDFANAPTVPEGFLEKAVAKQASREKGEVVETKEETGFTLTGRDRKTTTESMGLGDELFGNTTTSNEDILTDEEISSDKYGDTTRDAILKEKYDNYVESSGNPISQEEYLNNVLKPAIAEYRKGKQQIQQDFEDLTGSDTVATYKKVSASEILQQLLDNSTIQKKC
jgi:hypothetical protein